MRRRTLWMTTLVSAMLGGGLLWGAIERGDSARLGSRHTLSQPTVERPDRSGPVTGDNVSVATRPIGFNAGAAPVEAEADSEEPSEPPAPTLEEQEASFRAEAEAPHATLIARELEQAMVAALPRTGRVASVECRAASCRAVVHTAEGRSDDAVMRALSRHPLPAGKNVRVYSRGKPNADTVLFIDAPGTEPQNGSPELVRRTERFESFPPDAPTARGEGRTLAETASRLVPRGSAAGPVECHGGTCRMTVTHDDPAARDAFLQKLSQSPPASGTANVYLDESEGVLRTVMFFGPTESAPTASLEPSLPRGE